MQEYYFRKVKGMVKYVLPLYLFTLLPFVTSCNPEPDESDLYTFTGETIESFISKDEWATTGCWPPTAATPASLPPTRA